MANSDKNIKITPNISQTAQPNVVFTGQGNVPITLKVLDDSYGTLSFEGSAGQLFSINNNLTSGVIFAVNDVSGIPQIDVNANGTIRIGPFGGQVCVGISTPIATGLTINRLSTDAGTGQLMISNPNNTNVRLNLGYHTSSNYAFINSYTSSLSSQPLILQQWFDGLVGIGASTSPGAKLDIQVAAATTKGLIVKGFTSQSANLQEWQNSAGTVVASVGPAGAFTCRGFTLSNTTPTVVFSAAGSYPLLGADLDCGGNQLRNCGGLFQSGYAQFAIINPKIQFPSNVPTAAIEVGSTGQIKVTDASTGGGSFAFTSSSPSAYTTNQNDLVLTGSAFQRLSGTAARDITGVAPPSGGSHVDGRMMRIYNVGSFNLTLKHNSTSSTAANRFFCIQSVDIIVAANDFAELIYDGTNNGSGAAGWRVA